MIFSSVIYLYRGEDIVTDKMFNDIIDSIINNATDDEIEIINPDMHIDEAQQSSGMFVPFF